MSHSNKAPLQDQVSDGELNQFIEDTVSFAIGEGVQMARCKNHTSTFSELFELVTELHVDEFTTRAEFFGLDQKRQTQLKAEPGWWIHAAIEGGYRKKGNVKAGCVVTIDLDDLSPEEFQKIEKAGGVEGVFAETDQFFHTTRKHHPDAPRVRIALHADRAISESEYELIARLVAAEIGIDFCDHKSFRGSQMMFLPSVNVDDVKFYRFGRRGSRPFRVDALLKRHAKRGVDPKKPSTWPTRSDEQTVPREAGLSVENPLDKAGIVGAFCRAYPSISDEMNGGLLSSYYEAAYERMGEVKRANFIGGSGADGAVVYGDLHIFSHHASDPCSGQLVNIWDAVRLHSFGELDQGSPTDTPTNELPSFAAMVAFAKNDEATQAQLRADNEAAAMDALNELNEDEGSRGETVARMLKRYAMLHAGSGDLVLDMEAQPGEPLFIKWDSYRRLKANVSPLALGPGQAATEWLRDPGRRTFKGAGFYPEGEAPEGHFNTFKGWPVKPVEGDCSTIIAFVRDDICGGDEVAYQYVLAWCAQMLREPENKPGVMLVLKGRKGIGKDTFVAFMKGLVGAHYAHATDVDRVLTRFNDHLRDALLVHLEEAMWGGDKRKAGELQGLITGPTLTVERKFADVGIVPNRCHFIATTNEDWAVPAAGDDERRYAVIEVPDHWADNGSRDSTWRKAKEARFNELQLALQDRHQLSAFFFYLLNFDHPSGRPLAAVVRDVPKNDGLAEQKVSGFKGTDAFWADMLSRGSIETGVDGAAIDWEEGETVRTEDVYVAFRHSTKGRHGERNPSHARFSQRTTELFGESFRGREPQSKGKRRTFELPHLQDARRRFCVATGTTLSAAFGAGAQLEYDFWELI